MEVYCNSTAQSEITEMTSKLKQFAALVELYRDDMTDKDMFMSELSYFESVDWTKENYFNQLLAYTALGSAYGVLKCKNLDFTLAYYDNEYVYKEISYYHNVHYIVSRVSNEQWYTGTGTCFTSACFTQASIVRARVSRSDENTKW